MLSSVAHYSKISNLPQFTSMHPKSKKKSIVINIGLLAYTITKLGDNLTNNDRKYTHCHLKLDVKYIAFSASMQSGLNKMRLEMRGKA